MSIIDKILAKVGYVNKKRSSEYAAAQLSRLTSSWSTSSLSANQEIFRNLRSLRARSRELSRNNAHAKRFLNMVANNVIGPNGIKLQNKAGDYVKDKNGYKFEPDRIANTLIESHWDKWGKKGVCDITGRLSWVAFQRLYVITEARDGEVLVRKIRGAKNAYGFTLQIIDTDRLDERYNDTAPNGNLISMGIELNKNSKPAAYYILEKHPGEHGAYVEAGNRRERVPAEDMIHSFVADRPEQIRGIPWMHAAMMRLNMMGGFEEAAVIAARMGASKMGFFKTADGDGTGMADDVDRESGELIQEAEPGIFSILPNNMDFVAYDPKYPDVAFDPFLKACMRGIAAGLNVSYNSLSTDLENVNYSSIRQGVLDERDTWKSLQGHVSEDLHDPVFSDWLYTSLVSRALVLGGSSLPAGKYDKFNAATWQPRRWQWVDPEKDVNANILAINNRLKSRAQVIAEQGDDIEDIFAQQSQEQELAVVYGIELPVDPKQVPKPFNQP